MHGWRPGPYLDEIFEFPYAPKETPLLKRLSTLFRPVALLGLLTLATASDAAAHPWPPNPEDQEAAPLPLASTPALLAVATNARPEVSTVMGWEASDTNGGATAPIPAFRVASVESLPFIDELIAIALCAVATSNAMDACGPSE